MSSMCNLHELLALRELSHPSRRTWNSLKKQLHLWAEKRSLKIGYSSQCCIWNVHAIAISGDAQYLASVEDEMGKRTKKWKPIIKIYDITGAAELIKTLRSYRRIKGELELKFNPLNHEILASVSKDCGLVYLFNVKTGECVGYLNAQACIVSFAFHSIDEFLAVATKRKIIFWEYGTDESTTERFSFAINFVAVYLHPHQAPFYLTAEKMTVTETSMLTMTAASSTYYLHFPAPALVLQKLTESQISEKGLKDSSEESMDHLFGPDILCGSWYKNYYNASKHSMKKVTTEQHEIFARFGFFAELKILSPGRPCLLTIPFVVLKSDKGAHISPCGRFLAIVVLCKLSDADGASTSSAGKEESKSERRYIFELRLYSMSGATPGLVLAAGAIKAAECLTSVQFSPTSEHLLLAYGRNHNSLIRGLTSDREPIYKRFEIYRVPDLELVYVSTSARADATLASFSPKVGGGLIWVRNMTVLKFCEMHEAPLKSRFA